VKASCFVVAAAVLLIVGCGNDSSSETATLAKHQFLKQANAICKKSVEAQMAGFQQGLGESKQSQAKGNHDQEELRKILTKPIFKAVQKMIDEVSALGLPEGEEEVAKEIIEKFEVGLQKSEANPAIYLTGKAFKKADDAADAYGMNDCGV